MAITEIKIHPAIGIARVGNSPDEWFIGPETADMPPIPAGGYKDAQCRVKRQAARFRVFAYHDDGTDPTELTSDDATIEWTVALVHSKIGGTPITPTPRSISSPGGQESLDDGTFTIDGAPLVSVDLGEIRTDPDGRLIVLGGHGEAGHASGLPFMNNSFGWFDDTADGPVTASVTVDGILHEAAPAWVAVGPPDFAPTVRPVISLYDIVVREHIADGLMPAPSSTSFRRDVHPILQAAVGVSALHSTAHTHHTTMTEGGYPDLMPSPDTAAAQALRAAIVDRLKNAFGPLATMPVQNQNNVQLNGLTVEQFSHMQRWVANDFAADWSSDLAPLPLVPAELDRGPLSHCVGSPLDPGIEISFAIMNLDFAEPFRLADESSGGPAAGGLTSGLVVPWQWDFSACTENYWPSQRPGFVRAEPSDPGHVWVDDVPDAVTMIDNWHVLGFVVPQSGELLESERCSTPYITLLTPVLDFADVPLGPGGTPGALSLPIRFEVETGVAATFQIVSGADVAPFSRITMAPVLVGPTLGVAEDVFLWIEYQTQAVASSASDLVEVEHVESGRTWTVALQGNTVARVAAAAVLVLDRSFSMSESRGDGTSKLVGLQQAAELFVGAAHAGDAVGVVAFNHAVSGDIAVVELGPVGEPDPLGRDAIAAFVDAITPSGNTSIGDGLVRAQELLAAPSVAAYERRSVIVVTDGKETAPAWIADVGDAITASTYAIGIGTPANVDTATLQALTGNHGGYLLLTGPLTGDTQRRLVKNVLQILAGISNAEVLLDPDGRLAPGQQARIPFDVCECDHMLDVFVITERPDHIDIHLETPYGQRVDANTVGVEHLATRAGVMLRLALPVAVDPTRPAGAGRWAVTLAARHTVDPTNNFPNRQVIDYSVMINVYSNLKLDLDINQVDTRPGSLARIETRIGRGQAPLVAVVAADVTEPDGQTRRIELKADGAGRFTGSTTATRAGVHELRVRARGRSPLGWRFTREQTRTIAVEVPGPPPPCDRDQPQPGRIPSGCLTGWSRLAKVFRSVWLGWRAR